MKIRSLLFIFFMLVSCHLFTSEEQSREQLVEEEMQHINWEELDRYPLFENCDETADKGAQKRCFESTLLQHLKVRLQQEQFTVNESVNDTAWIQLLVDNRGNIRILGIEKRPETTARLPELDAVLKNGLTDLPRLYPPLKRDIPVAAKFKIPVVLRVE